MSEPRAIGPYVYHGTSEGSLPGIRKHGLIPKRRPNPHKDPEIAVPGKAVFFAPLEEWARSWGPVILRFPWPAPEEVEEDSYGDTILLESGEIVRTGYYTRDAVPPWYIEMKNEDGRWKPLLDRRRWRPWSVNQ